MKLRIISLFVFLCLGMIWTLKAQELKKISYGSKDGMDLVMGVKKPKNPNGAGVIMVVSGGFKSSWEQALNMSHLSSPLTARGYTLFLLSIVHNLVMRHLTQ